MARRKQGAMFESVTGPDATPEPPAPRTEALESFLLGEGVEPPAPPAPVSLHADLWMLGTPTYQRKIVFTESVGGRFGDIGLTTRFCLDNWSQSPNGFRWTLDPSAPAQARVSERAEDILRGCFTRTVSGLAKLAVAEHGGDMDGAIIQALDEQLTLLGLDRYIPDEPQEAW